MQAVDARRARVQFILREVESQVVDCHRMHAPQERFLGDFLGLGGSEFLIAASCRQRCEKDSDKQGRMDQSCFHFHRIISFCTRL